MAAADLDTKPKRRRWPRILGFGCLGTLAVFLIVVIAVGWMVVPRGDGGRTERSLVAHASDHYSEGTFTTNESFNKGRSMAVQAELHFEDALTEADVTELTEFMEEQRALATDRDWYVMQAYTLVFPHGEVLLSHASEATTLAVASAMVVNTTVTTVHLGSTGWIDARLECDFDDQDCLASAAEAAHYGFDRLVAHPTDPQSIVSVQLRGSGEELRGQLEDTLAAWPHTTTVTGSLEDSVGYFVYPGKITLAQDEDVVQVRTDFDYVNGSVTDSDRNRGREMIIDQLETRGGETKFEVAEL
ncbi:hypothetical protein [Gulosibacter chungangensis]|uniref:Uncharacterized protein n=1 Tax=Gulosibacter chungangensis TaxID=979746 RepID=A0A7J5BAT6_9MICO|nr:hypothetical protein [Gulosibacter chungangensis]KAB1643153.1 hypothetical protein F8O05_07905 [Gulosibacter chungangensis]